MGNWTVSKPLKDYEKVIVPENRYVMVLLDLKEEKSKAGNDMLTFGFDITEGNYKGAFVVKHIKHYIVQDEKGDWERKLGALMLMIFESNGLPTEKKSFNPEDKFYIGLKVGCFIEQKEDTFNGHDFLKNNIQYFCRVKDVEGWVPPVKKPSKTKAEKPVSEEEVPF